MLDEKKIKEIQERANASYVQNLLKRTGELTPQLASAGRSLLGVGKSKKPLLFLGANDEEGLSAQARLMALKDADRLAIFRALHPKVGGHIDAAWRNMERFPYSIEYGFKPFRAPGNPEALIGRRAAWTQSMLARTAAFDEPVTWFAAHAAYIDQWGWTQMGPLFAAAIDSRTPEGDEVFEILCATIRGDHPIAKMSRDAVSGLLSASREDGWVAVEKLLLAAQREEGLRQTILESIDLAHPEAFRRILRVIRENDLARFSSVVRAADVWLGLQWDSQGVNVINSALETVEQCLADAKAREAALAGKDAEKAYFALWAICFDNVANAFAPAEKLLKHKHPEFRFVATKILAEIGLPRGFKLLMKAIDDDAPHVLANAVRWLADPHKPGGVSGELFARLEDRLSVFPQKATTLKPLVWPWEKLKHSKAEALRCMAANLGGRRPVALTPYLSSMAPETRAFTAQQLASQKLIDSATRAALFTLLSDASSYVRKSALEGLARCKATAEEAQQVEKLLTRNAGDLRRGVLCVLMSQNDAGVLASIERLLAAASLPERLGGLELARRMTELKRSAEHARALAQAYAQNRQLSEAEETQLKAICSTGETKLTLENGLGLFDPAKLTVPPAPAKKKILLHSPTSVRIIKSLDAIILANLETKVRLIGFDKEPREQLLGEFQYFFPAPAPTTNNKLTDCPGADLWIKWCEERPADLRDDDGFELARTLALLESTSDGYGAKTALRNEHKATIREIFGDEQIPKSKVLHLVKGVLEWLVAFKMPAGFVDYALDAAETSLAKVPAERLYTRAGDEAPRITSAGDFWLVNNLAARNWRDDFAFVTWLEIAEKLRVSHSDQWTPQHDIRLWQLQKWLDQPDLGQRPPGFKPLPRYRPDIAVIGRALKLGAANEADVLDEFVGPRSGLDYSQWSSLGEFSAQRPTERIREIEFLRPLFERARERVLDVELARGDNPTIVTDGARALDSVWGMERLGQMLQAMGSRSFSRGYSYDSAEKEATFSRLIRRAFPKAGEDHAKFAEVMRARKIGEERLIELAVYAPQWAGFVERLLGWPSLEEAVWWIHAHTKGTDWTLGVDLRESWLAEMARRTPLEAGDLQEGGVDVAWFERCYAALGRNRWESLYEAAKFASSGPGHTRAKLFADAMLGSLNKKELITRIKTKRHQDAVRALGLLPLAKGAAREKDVLDRFKLIQEFAREARQFGSQRQASEKRAAAIGQENLARTAGYRDPIRLQWSMEAKAIADLAEGPIEVEVEGVKFSLGVDAFGAVELAVSREGKTLSDAPAKLKKHPKVVALKERRAELRKQAARVRPTLEALMCRGDTFTSEELQELCKHPLIAPMFKNLVIIGDEVMGYPSDGGKTVQDHAGNKEALKKRELLRIAHPVDFWPAAKWQAWQKDCMASERIQPFKQVFRELYKSTSAELEAKDHSRRYAGHQVNPRQALALLGAKGWTTQAETGVSKTFHDAGIVAAVEFLEPFYTPAEVEGLTIENVHFIQRKGGAAVQLKDVPERLFSEVMRDLDLVVSVAHRGGVDPEASASTIEMRAALVRETCELLKIKNVRVQENRALIDGAMGKYSVHLGSAVTHRLPGGALFIVPVHAQHRGRLFLPFADDDPKTAEALSKILMLARDSEIKDPTVVQQLIG